MADKTTQPPKFGKKHLLACCAIGATLQYIFAYTSSNDATESHGWYWGSYLSLLSVGLTLIISVTALTKFRLAHNRKLDYRPIVGHVFILVTIHLYLVSELMDDLLISRLDHEFNWVVFISTMVLMLIILPFVTINSLDHQSVYNRIRAQFFIFTINLYPLLEIINHFGRPSLDHQFNWLVFIPSVLIAITANELLSCSITSAFAPAVSTFLFFLYGATLQLIIFGSNSYIFNEPNAWYWASLLSFLTISIPFLKCFWPRNVPQNGGAIKADWPPLEKTSHLFFRITIFLFLLIELINQYWVPNLDYQTSWTLLLFVILSWPLSSYFRTEIPSAHFTSSQSIGEGKVVSFAGTESYRISSYSWDYGDGIQRTNEKRSSKHTYKDAGTYRVSLTISGDIGADTCTKQLKVTKVKRKAKKHIPIHKFLPMNFLVEPCMRCLETEMSLLKISPNGNSIQYQCTSCNKKKHAAALSPEAKKRAVSHLNSKNQDQIIFSTNDAPLPYEQTTRSPIPESVRSEVWRRDMGKCVQCESNQNLQFDHIIPFSKGGSNSARNLQLLCQRCNASKSNKI